jgi:hypothetical protein
MKKAVSFTLDPRNILWLRAQAAATTGQTASSIVDRLLTDARLGGRIDPAAIRSVAGTIDLPDDDPDLAQADAFIRTIFERSIGRPQLVKERRAPSRAARRRRRG